MIKMMMILTYCVLATLAVAGIQGTSTECGANVTIPDTITPDLGVNTSCAWFIPRVKSQVAILFSGLNLNDSVYSLTVLGSEDNITYTVIANVTKLKGSVQVMSQFNFTKIAFSRNTLGVQSATFSASITNDCIQVIPQSSGLINSPIYRTNNRTFTCTYQVAMETPGYVFVLRFSNISLPKGNLSVKFGQNSETSWNGTDLPPILVGSKDENLTITLNLFNNDAQSFAAAFSMADARCSGTFTAGDTTRNITLPTENDYPVICYAQFSTLNKSRQLLVDDIGRPPQTSGVDSIIFYDSIMSAEPIAGDIAEGLRTFVSSGVSITMVANLGIGTSRSDTIMARQDSFSKLFHLTNGTDSYSLNGTLVNNADVLLQFSAVPGNQKIVIELSPTTILTSATVKVTCAMHAPMVTFNNDSVLFPVVIPTNRAIVSITNLNANQFVTITATAINDSNCNQLYTSDSEAFAVPSNATGCTTAIVTAKSQTLELMSVNQCANTSLDIYDGFSKTSRKIATLSTTYANSNIPPINFNSGARLLWQSKNTTCLTDLTGRYFVQGSYDNWCGNMGTGTITTPHFPNQYPLNVQSTCQIRSNSNATRWAYFAFQSVQMLSGHSVTVQSNNKTVFTLNGSLLLPDTVVPYANLSVTFNSLTKGQDLEPTGQGVQMNYTFLECGQFANSYNGTISSPANQSATCIWIISTLPNDTKTAYIVNASFIPYIQKTNISKWLEIRDGGSSRDRLVSMLPNNIVTSTTNLLWVKYICVIQLNITDCSGFSIKYTTYNCTTLCANRMCMLPEWRCDGQLQCPDGSDELNCTAPPLSPTTTPVSPTSRPTPTGIAGYWIFLCLVFGLIIGIILTVFAPRFIHAVRGRGGHRSNYGALSEDA